MRMIFKNLGKKSRIGLVINWSFHKKDKWVSAYSPYLIRALIKEFDPIIITDIFTYKLFKNRLDYILSMEPGWAAPFIKFDSHAHKKVIVFVSDPHKKVDWLEEYVESSNINFILSYYDRPFWFHFPNFDRDKFIHFPWSVPDQFIISETDLENKREKGLHLFGGVKSDAYELRRWCKSFDFVNGHSNSGVENKVYNNADFYMSNRNYDSIIAAGSLSPKYQLVTPKYFEIPAAGALLFAQNCEDLHELGFNESNCVIFNKEDFIEKAQDYLSKPESYKEKKINGTKLIREKHSLSHRIRFLKSLFSE